jgi:hypothetical protein
VRKREWVSMYVCERERVRACMCQCEGEREREREREREVKHAKTNWKLDSWREEKHRWEPVCVLPLGGFRAVCFCYPVLQKFGKQCQRVLAEKERVQARWNSRSSFTRSKTESFSSCRTSCNFSDPKWTSRRKPHFPSEKKEKFFN